MHTHIHPFTLNKMTTPVNRLLVPPLSCLMLKRLWDVTSPVHLFFFLVLYKLMAGFCCCAFVALVARASDNDALCGHD